MVLGGGGGWSEIRNSTGPKWYFKTYFFRYFRSHLLAILLFLPRPFDEISDFFLRDRLLKHTIFFSVIVWWNSRVFFLRDCLLKFAIFFQRSFADFFRELFPEVRDFFQRSFDRIRTFYHRSFAKIAIFSRNCLTKLGILFHNSFKKLTINCYTCTTKFAIFLPTTDWWNVIFFAISWRNLFFFF